MAKPLLKMSRKQATTPKKPVTPAPVKVVPVKAVPVVKVLPIPVEQRYNQQAKPDPLGRFMVTGEPWPENRLAVSDAAAKAAAAKAAAELRLKQKRHDAEAARRAGFKE